MGNLRVMPEEDNFRLGRKLSGRITNFQLVAGDLLGLQLVSRLDIGSLEGNVCFGRWPLWCCALLKSLHFSNPTVPSLHSLNI